MVAPWQVSDRWKANEAEHQTPEVALKDDETTQGFSFQLSASPPPARAAAPLDAPTPTGEDDDWLMPPSPAAMETERPGASAAPTIAADAATRTPPPASARVAQPTVKRIAFPRPGPTLFSSSVSQAPPKVLAPEEPEGTPPPEKVRLSVPSLPASPAETGRRAWATARRWALRGGRHAARAAALGGRHLRTAGRAIHAQALATWRRHPDTAQVRPEAFSSDDLAPPVESPSTVGPSWASRLRPALSATAALAAAGVCYAGVGLIVPEAASQAADEAPAEAISATAGPAAPDQGAKTPSGSSATSKADPAAVEQLPLPEGLSWPGKGLIEVVTGGRELIYVDGVFTGRGPLRRIPIAPGQHEVVLRTEAGESKHAVSVTLDRRARLVVGQPRPEEPG